MTTIIRTSLQSNFTQIDNTLLVSDIPAKPKTVLLYLLSKPAHWQVKFNDIKHRLGLSAYAVRQSLKWLLDHGYAIYERLKSGHTIWRIFDQAQEVDAPQTRVVEPHVEIPPVENQHDLVIRKKSEIPNPTTATKPAESISVVVNDEIIESNLPESIPNIEPALQSVAQKHLSELTKTQTALVLTVFTNAIKTKSINNRIGYFIGLCKASKNGTLTDLKPSQHQTIESLTDRLTKERERTIEAANRGKMSNEDFFEMLKRKFNYDPNPASIDPKLKGIKSLKKLF